MAELHVLDDKERAAQAAAELVASMAEEAWYQYWLYLVLSSIPDGLRGK